MTIRANITNPCTILSITMKLDVAGQMRIEEAEGNGPVDAVFNCIKALVPHEAKLELYQVHAVTEGTDAQAEVSVRLAHGGPFIVRTMLSMSRGLRRRRTQRKWRKAKPKKAGLVRGK